MSMGRPYRPALHNYERYYYQIIYSALWMCEVIVKYCDNTSKTELDTAGQKCVKQRCIYANIFFMNYMPVGIGRHYIIRRDSTIKLYIVHYGYVVEVIVKYCANT